MCDRVIEHDCRKAERIGLEKLIRLPGIINGTGLYALLLRHRYRNRRFLGCSMGWQSCTVSVVRTLALRMRLSIDEPSNFDVVVPCSAPYSGTADGR